MQNYMDLLEKVMHRGNDIKNERTGKVCRTLVGEQIAFDLDLAFPIMQTRPIPFKSIVGEFIGFIKGYTSAKDFRHLNCNFWNQNANETKDWLANHNRIGEDDLGRIYGAQWVDWNSFRFIEESKVDYYRNLGYTVYATTQVQARGKEKPVVFIAHKTINQLAQALELLIINPSDRRIIVSAWNHAEMDLMALPPCHMDYRFTVINNKLDCVMTQRSCDVYLGLPSNIVETALFTHTLAHMVGLTPGKICIQLANTHVYEDHFEAVYELLEREVTILSKNRNDNTRLVLSNDFPIVTCETAILSTKLRQDTLSKLFTKIKPEHFELHNYKPQRPIEAKAPMSA